MKIVWRDRVEGHATWHLGHVGDRLVVAVPQFEDARKLTCTVEQLVCPRSFDSVADAQVHAEAWFDACVLVGALQTSDVMRLVSSIREQIDAKRGGK